jgi:hypothetical protein
MACSILSGLSAKEIMITKANLVNDPYVFTALCEIREKCEMSMVTTSTNKSEYNTTSELSDFSVLQCKHP